MIRGRFFAVSIIVQNRLNIRVAIVKLCYYSELFHIKGYIHI